MNRNLYMPLPDDAPTGSERVAGGFCIVFGKCRNTLDSCG